MSDEKQIVKRGRQAPSFPLARAIEMLEQVNTNLGDGPFSRDAIAQGLGYKSVSGSVTIRIGTLTHYELLERSAGGSYSISNIGRRILIPESEFDRRNAISEAAVQPTLYSEIMSEFSGQALPKMFGNILVHKFGVLPKQRDEVADIFREAMLFAGLLRNGILFTQPSPDELDNADEEELEAGFQESAVGAASPIDSTVSLVAGPTHKSKSDSHQEYTIPLDRNGRVAHLYLPTPVKTSDLASVERWARFMSEFDVDRDVDREG